MNYFKEQAEKQKNVENYYISKSKVLRMIERCNDLAEKHLSFVNAKGVPQVVSDWHESKSKHYMETGARLIAYYNKL